MALKIKVLIIDDSAFMRLALKKILTQNPNIEVYTARNGIDGLEKLKNIKPDVVTLDIEMPVMNGIETLKHIMKENPTPVIMISSYTQEGLDITMQCLQLGAVDFIGKPSGEISLDIDIKEKEIINKVIAAANVKLSKFLNNRKERSIDIKRNFKTSRISVVCIGTSTGGPRTLMDIIPYIPSDINVPIFIVQHMPPRFTKSLANRLNSMSKLNVKEAEDNEDIKVNNVYIAPGDWHLTIKEKILNKKYSIHLTKEPSNLLFRPSVNVLFFSAAKVFNSRVLAVLLTGMGRDGADGMREIKRRGGITIAEDESTAVIFGMPAAAIEEGSADYILPSYKIASAIKKIVKGR